MIITKHTPNKHLNNVFDDFFNTFSNNWNTKNEFVTPAVNIIESAEGYSLELLAPGRNKEDFKLNLDKGLLTISYENQPAENKEQKFVRKEFSLQNFKRTFSLDDKINSDGIEARYDNGVLKIFLPKKEEINITAKQIAIQ